MVTILWVLQGIIVLDLMSKQCEGKKMLNRVNHQVLKFKKSGIRKFAEAAAKMEGVVSLTIGEPEFDTEVVIKDAAKKALDDNCSE